MGRSALICRFKPENIKSTRQFQARQSMQPNNVGPQSRLQHRHMTRKGVSFHVWTGQCMTVNNKIFQAEALKYKS